VKGAVLGQATDSYCCTVQFQSAARTERVTAVCTQKLPAATYHAFCSFWWASGFSSVFASLLLGFFDFTDANHGQEFETAGAYNDGVYHM
jgi:hypothetical protein